jgi:hypothetical protein
MKVLCIAELPNEEQARKIIGRYIAGKQVFSVEVGREYIVYGIEILGEMPWVRIEDDYEQISSAPLCLFEVVDPSVPSIWEARMNSDCVLMLLPPSFYREGFIEDLLDGDPSAVAELRRVRSRLNEL